MVGVEGWVGSGGQFVDGGADVSARVVEWVAGDECGCYVLKLGEGSGGGVVLAVCCECDYDADCIGDLNEVAGGVSFELSRGSARGVTIAREPFIYIII